MESECERHITRWVVGDFNADISRTSVFRSISHDFCNCFSFSIVDKDYLPAEMIFLQRQVRTGGLHEYYLLA